MTISFVNSLQSEWIKRKRSLASWLAIVGGFFTPSIIIVARVVHSDRLPALYAASGFWKLLWRNSWESMALFLLPIGVILATSLVTQMEYKNNTWKQLHTVPLTLTAIFFSKLVIILAMMLQFFLLFNIGIYLSAVIPYLLFPDVSYPKESIPFMLFLKENMYYFVDCLPIIALQYLISLRYKNFLIPIGAGFMLWVAALGSLSWKYGYVIPYTYGMFNFLKGEVVSKASVPAVNIHWMSVGYFIAITGAGYVLYVTKKEKG